jgi:hypothetical protein
MIAATTQQLLQRDDETASGHRTGDLTASL